nr:hypothetical protein [Micromonospora sp. DSM 115978]
MSAAQIGARWSGRHALPWRVAVLATTITALSGVLIGPGPATAVVPAAPAEVTGGSRPFAGTRMPTAAVTPTGPASGAIPAGAPAGAGVCGGRLPFGRVKSCPSISDTQRNVWTVTTTVDQDTLLARLRGGSGDIVDGWVTDDTGTDICSFSFGLRACQLGAAGVYHVTVRLSYGSGEAAYTLSVESTRTPSKCVSLPKKVFSFASTGRPGTLPAGLAAACFTFDLPTGSVLLTALSPGADLRGDILAADHQRLCGLGPHPPCELSRPGPYRLFLQSPNGNESTYILRLPRLSQPVGCSPLPLAALGDPGAAIGEVLLEGNSMACHALRARTAGAVVVRLDPNASMYLRRALYDANGHEVCDETTTGRSCALPAAGRYTVVTHNSGAQRMPYQIAVASLRDVTGCAPTTGTNWDQPTLVVHQTSALHTNCQPFQAEAGDQMIVYRAPVGDNEMVSWLVDERGAVLCAEVSLWDDCSLPTSGTIRVISYLRWWDADDTILTYRMQVRRLSNPVGCPRITPGAYNAAPAGALGTIGCRTLEIGAPGLYRVRAVNVDNHPLFGTIYDLAGRSVCSSIECRFTAAGRYTLVLAGGDADRVIGEDVWYAVALLPSLPSSGCPVVSDTGWQGVPHRGGFTTAGQFNCLELASPTGSRLVLALPGDATGAGSPAVTVMDSTGTFICHTAWGLTRSQCELTGEAPFLAVLNSPGGSPTGQYSLAFVRTDGPPACPVLPAGTEGSTVATGADRFAVCFTIPADQRADRESITYRRTVGTGDARLSVFDSTGARHCGPTGDASGQTITCSPPPGPMTVLLEADAVAASYQLTHRDANAPPP